MGTDQGQVTRRRLALAVVATLSMSALTVTAYTGVAPARQVQEAGTLTYAAVPSSLGAIPDGTGPGPGAYGASRDVRFTVPTGYVRSSVSVEMQVSHTFVGDLDAVLTSPDGMSMTLFSRTGAVNASDRGYGSDLAAGSVYAFADTATASWWSAAGSTSPIPGGAYRTAVPGPTGAPAAPSSLNATFAGGSEGGTWTLSLRDGAAGDTGAVTSATLRLGAYTKQVAADPASLGPIADGGAAGPGDYGAARDVTFDVAGMTGAVSTVVVYLQIDHSYVGDLDVVLRSPGGGRSLVIFSRTGAITPDDFGYNSELTAGAGYYTFADSAVGSWWAASATSPVSVGSYRTSVAGPTVDPAPPTSLNAAFGGLDAAGANGVWTLSVRDGAADDIGAVNGATLVVGTAGAGVLADTEGDAKADISLFRPQFGGWFSRPSSGAPDTGVGYGMAGDVTVPADYDGDRRTDVAIYRPPTGLWSIHNSAFGSDTGFTYGVSTDTPVPADYDGDGLADVAIYRSAAGLWYVHRSSDGADIPTTFGIDTDIPVPADYDGDGKADLGIFRPSSGTWFVHPSASSTDTAIGYGAPGDVPIAGDFDGDGKADLAIYRPATGLWSIHNSASGTDTALTYGIDTDIPVPADYDGDGKADVGIFRPQSGAWYVRRSTNGADRVVTFGISGDQPLALPAAVRDRFY